MSALVAIGWAVALIVSAWIVRMFMGNADMVAMFPEGRSWWMPWSRLLSLAIFAAVVLANPFSGWLV